MDVGNMLDWVYLRLCFLPRCQSLHKSRGVAGINSNAQFVSAPGAAASLQLRCSSNCAMFVQGFHTQLPQLSGSQHFCFSASGTPSTSVMPPITGLLLGWTTKRCIKLEQTWQEMPHSFSSVWGWRHVQGDGPKSLVCNSLALGRVPPQGQDGWGYTRDDSLERLFVGAYIRDHEPLRVLHGVIIAK